MANIKKVKLSNSDLPSLNPNTSGYLLRYRIVSEDLNRSSHWSQVFSVVPGYTYQSGSLSTSNNGNSVSATWDHANREINSNAIGRVPKYDVWVSLDASNSWYHADSVTQNSLSFLVPAGTVSYRIEIYDSTSPATRVPEFLIYESPSEQTI